MANGTSDVDAVSYGNLIGLNTESASPPTHAYISADDTLHVFIASSLATPVVRVFARLLLPDSTIVPNAWTFAPVNGRAGQSFFQTLTEGFLLSLGLDAPNATTTGQTFVRITILRGSQSAIASSALLVQGYATATDLLSWPASPAWPKSYGSGNIRSITGTNPASGVEISETVPLLARWRLAAFTFTLATSATGGTRTTFLTIDDGTNVLVRVNPAGTLAASVTNVFSYADNFALNVNAVYQMLPLPSQFILLPGYRIRSNTLGIVAGDLYFGIQYVVEEWISG